MHHIPRIKEVQSSSDMTTISNYSDWSKSVEQYLKGAPATTLDVPIRSGLVLHPVNFQDDLDCIHPITWHHDPMQVLAYGLSAKLSDWNSRAKWILSLGVNKLVLDLDDCSTLNAVDLLQGIHLNMIDLEVLNFTTQQLESIESLTATDLTAFRNSKGIYLAQAKPSHNITLQIRDYAKEEFVQLIHQLEDFMSKMDGNQRLTIELKAMDDILELMLYARVAKLICLKICNSEALNKLALILDIDLQSKVLANNIAWTAQLSAGFLSSMDGAIYHDQLNDLDLNEWKHCSHTAVNNFNILSLEADLQKVPDPLSGSYWMENACAQMMMELFE